MNKKLSPKAKKGILIAMFVILALVAVYYVFWGRKKTDPVSSDAATLEIVDAGSESAASANPAEESKETEIPDLPEVSTEVPEESEALPFELEPSSSSEEAYETIIPVTQPVTTPPTSAPTSAPPTTAAPTVPPTTAPPTTAAPTVAPTTEAPTPSGITVRENGTYTDKEHVALYIHTYGKLPSNFITKSKANALGWESGNLWKYAPGKSIGGDRFGNREGLLPRKSGRQYYECDIDYNGGSRNAKRIVYSNDGLIFYTEDHYETFTQLY